MSFFGDIGDAIGGVVSGVVNAVSDVANSTVGQIALDIAGSFAGDPALGQQVAQYAGEAKTLLTALGVNKPVATKTVTNAALLAARGLVARTTRYRAKNGGIYNLTLLVYAPRGQRPRVVKVLKVQTVSTPQQTAQAQATYNTFQQEKAKDPDPGDTYLPGVQHPPSPPNPASPTFDPAIPPAALPPPPVIQVPGRRVYRD